MRIARRSAGEGVAEPLVAGGDSNHHVPHPVRIRSGSTGLCLYWYFERFASSGSPLGHSSCLDIRTLHQVIAGAVFDRSGRSAMPDSLRPAEPHTYNALDDAVEQGEL